jgi:protein SCO1/2
MELDTGMTPRLILSAFALTLALAPRAGAHSLEELEKALAERERYVEFRNESAPEFALQDVDGRPVALRDFRGKVVVLNFIFASCTDVCPLHSELIASIQKDINQTPMRELVQFVTVTTDPERDTAEVLKPYGATHGLDPANWVFLTSGAARPDETRSIAMRYGLRFTPTPDGQFMHGVVTHLIDKEGLLRARYHGLKVEPTNFIVHVNALVNDFHKPHDEPSFWTRLRRWF